jgi:tetratricopeptide (TPR) repeat protein
MSALDAALKIHPAFAAAHHERGDIFAARGDDASALKAFAEAQKHDPKHSSGYTSIGMVHQRNQQWADAELAYLLAVAVEPGNARAYNNLAWMAAERKADLPQAVAWAVKATSLAPRAAEFRVTLGWVYRAQGDLARAEQTLRAAVSLDATQATTLYYLGRVHLEQRKTTEGMAELKKALALQPDFRGADEARALLAKSGRN